MQQPFQRGAQLPQHWDHLRTSKPIENVFATVRHRTVRTKGTLPRDTARLMAFKLVMVAAKTWRWLKNETQLPWSCPCLWSGC